MEIMINDEVDFDSLKNRCQNNLEPMKGSKFGFDYAQLLYFKCYEVNLNCGGSYIQILLIGLKAKKARSPINKKDNKYFQFAVSLS